MQEKFLITGASGFIGSNIVRKLIGLHQKVSIIVRNKNLNWRLKEVSNKVDIHVHDVLKPGLDGLVRKIQPTIIYHLAAYGVSPKDNNAESMIDVNIKGLNNVIQAAKTVSIKLLVNTGSSSEYGIKSAPIRESDIPLPINDYGICKAAMTLYCQKVAKTENFPIITYRLFSPYGPFESNERFIPTVIARMLKNKPLRLSSPSYVRDFIYIDDVVNAYLSVIDRKVPFGSVVNIGSGKQYNLHDVVHVVQQYTKSKAHVIWNARKPQKRQIEPLCWQADITYAYKILGWKPKYTLEEGIEKTIHWIRNNYRFYA